MSSPQPAVSSPRSARPKAREATRGLRFTREGRVFVVMTLGVGAAAVNTGNNLLYLVLGLMLSLIVLSGVLSDLVLWWVTVRRALPERAFAGRPCITELSLRNDKRWVPSFSLNVEDEAEGAPTERRCYFLKVAPGGEETAAYLRTPMRRGLLQLARFRVTTRYPFGLFDKWRLIEDRAELLVFPALEPVLLPVVPSGFARDPQPAPFGPPGPDIAGLRDHREGDEARAVHARRSAALGRLIVRERDREAGAQLTLVLDEARPADATDAWSAAFERAVSQAAFIAERSLRRGSSVELRCRTGHVPFVLPGRAADPILAHLARLQPRPLESAPPLPAVHRPHVRIVPGHEPVTIEGRA